MIDTHTRYALLILVLLSAALRASDESTRPDFEKLKAEGALRSRYLSHSPQGGTEGKPAPGLETFERVIEPILRDNCFSCHGPERKKGGIRIDELDPNLFDGEDVDWWLEVLAVLTNGEMPPPRKSELPTADRSAVIEWLSAEVQAASTARRASQAHSSFRHMTRYEYEYALQDLLGLPFAFARDLLPDPTSEDGFENTSDSLHLTATQLATYLDAGRQALLLATVRGDRPTPLRWSIRVKETALTEFAKQDARIEQTREKHKDNPQRLEKELAKLTAGFRARPRATYYEDLESGRIARHEWAYGKAKYAWKPQREDQALSDDSSVPRQPSNHITIIPRETAWTIELGDEIPERGNLRVRAWAAAASSDEKLKPSLRLMFGWQASNDSRAKIHAGVPDQLIEAAEGKPQLYEWTIPLSQLRPRNSVRGTNKLGDLPSPSEFIQIRNASMSGCDIHVHHVEIEAPTYESWPPASHTHLFPARSDARDEAYAREVLSRFMSRAWRRPPSRLELQRKLDRLESIRETVGTFEEALVEVLASVLASPNFLYIGVESSPREEPVSDAGSALSEGELATRLSMFLWCSSPDDELLSLAADRQLGRPDILVAQVERMLSDPKSRRLSTHFVRQWLGLSLLDYLHVDKKAHPRFNPALKAAMEEEPIEFFHELLQENVSVLEFIHSSFTVVNERLAKHYGLVGVIGNQFQRVALDSLPDRGGILTQAGMLAMNSDGKDSHPLKRGVWMLERLLNDPPPPPPPAVPEIDLADPEIAKMTLKERIEDHRNHPACLSCHAKIDPWGIAFENYDAVGQWRTEVEGRPIDSRSLLFNQQELDGMDGLKAFLLEHRQDQFVRALVHKLTTYGLGRSLTFEDRAAVDDMTAEVRRRGDGLATMVQVIATSDLFRKR